MLRALRISRRTFLFLCRDWNLTESECVKVLQLSAIAEARDASVGTGAGSVDQKCPLWPHVKPFSAARPGPGRGQPRRGLEGEKEEHDDIYDDDDDDDDDGDDYHDGYDTVVGRDELDKNTNKNNNNNNNNNNGDEDDDDEGYDFIDVDAELAKEKHRSYYLRNDRLVPIPKWHRRNKNKHGDNGHDTWSNWEPLTTQRQPQGLAEAAPLLRTPRAPPPTRMASSAPLSPLSRTACSQCSCSSCTGVQTPTCALPTRVESGRALSCMGRRAGYVREAQHGEGWLADRMSSPCRGQRRGSGGAAASASGGGKKKGRAREHVRTQERRRKNKKTAVVIDIRSEPVASENEDNGKEHGREALPSGLPPPRYRFARPLSPPCTCAPLRLPPRRFTWRRDAEGRRLSSSNRQGNGSPTTMTATATSLPPKQPIM